MSTTLGATLRFTRLEAKKTLKDIEAETGISNAYLSQFESGKIKSPAIQKIEALAAAYGIPYNLLMLAAGYAPVHSVEAKLNLPVFIIQAAETLVESDWELLRPLVGHLVKGHKQP